jgi:hypothetical protein
MGNIRLTVTHIPPIVASLYLRGDIDHRHRRRSPAGRVIDSGAMRDQL